MIPEKSWFILNTFKQEGDEFCRPTGYAERRFERLLSNLLMLKQTLSSPRVLCSVHVFHRLGICGNVDMWSFLTDEEMLDMWSTWEHWSGDIDWPIRYTGIEEQGKWEGKTKQSKQRYELLDHCINHVQKLITQQKDTDEN